MNGQPVFIDEEGMIRAGMDGKFNGKKLDEMTDEDWKHGGEAQKGEKADGLGQKQGEGLSALKEGLSRENLESAASTVKELVENERNRMTPFVNALQAAEGVNSNVEQWVERSSPMTQSGKTVLELRRQISTNIDESAKELEQAGKNFEDTVGCSADDLKEIGQAGLRDGREAFAAAAEQLPEETAEKLLEASMADPQDLDIPAEELESINETLNSHPLVKAMLAQDIILFGKEPRSDIFNNNLRALAVFVHFGGNLDDLQACEGFLVNPMLFEAVEQGRTQNEQMAHELGVGFSGMGLGVMDFMDTLALLPRFAMNKANGLLGGDPEYFKPAAQAVQPYLAQPENEIEAISYAANRFAGNAAAGVATGGILSGVGKIGSAGQIGATNISRTQRVGEFLAVRPGTQAASSAVSGAAGEIVRQAGGGPVVQMAVEIATGSLTPGGKGKGTKRGNARAVKDVERAQGHSAANIEPRTTYKADSGTVDADLGPMAKSLPGKGEVVPHNPNNSGEGKLIKENPKQKFKNKSEKAAADAWIKHGYDVTHRKEKSSILGDETQNIRTSDFEIKDIGFVDAYGPSQNTSAENIANNIRKKGDQTGIVHIVSDIDEIKLQKVLDNFWIDNSDKAKNIILIFKVQLMV